MTAGELHDVLSHLGAELIIEALAKLESGLLTCVAQPSDGVTYAKKIDKSETRIDFSRSAREIVDHIRGLSPHPGAWFEAETGGKRERVKVLAAKEALGSGTPGTVVGDDLMIACGAGAIQVVRLQRAGRQPMTAEEFLRGARLPRGSRLA
jgi:methionyl-tRNA formyltransferase